MSSLKLVNVYRRKIMHFLTKSIGNPNDIDRIRIKEKVDVKHVLICRPNQRLGNLLLITALIKELINLFPKCKIDIIVKGSLASIVYENFENVDQIIILPRKPFNELFKYIKVWLSIRTKKYDLAINAVEGSSSGKLLTQFSSAKYKIYGDFDMQNQKLSEDRNHMAKNPVYNLRYYLKLIGYNIEPRDIPNLNIKLSPSEITKGKEILKNLVNNNNKNICIFTYATGNKCYCVSWWEEFYNKLLQAFPEYNIIEILPMENVSQINFKAISFYSKNIREIAALMSQTEIFIGADSGITHLASATQIPTVGLFYVTNPENYAPYGNNSIAIKTNEVCSSEILEKVEEILVHN